MIARRLLVFGGVAVGLAAAGAIVIARFAGSEARRTAAVKADYLAGRVVVRATWIMSETEAADFPAEMLIPPAASSSEVSGGDEAG